MTKMKIVVDNKLISRKLFLIILDGLLINFSVFFALFVRFDFCIGKIPTHYTDGVLSYMLTNTIITILIFGFFRLYKSLWRYAGVDELVNILYGCLLAGVAQYIGMHFVYTIHVPRSFYPLSTLFMMGTIGFSRFFYRYVRKCAKKSVGKPGRRIMIIGAGEAANVIMKEIAESPCVEGVVVCVIDDNRTKIGRYIQGVKIVGDRYKIKQTITDYQVSHIIIAMPSATKVIIKEILEICKDTGCSLKILPGMYQLINEEVGVTSLRQVEIEDLLGRDIVDTDLEKVMNYVKGKVVMVTGGGGSIGSELCRQIAKYNPKQLIIFDIYENNAYFIEQELSRLYPFLDLVVLIGSVRNTKRINDILSNYRPNIIYHAAAHKHVPLMEKSPNEAIKNNVGGTYKVVQAADQYGVEKFILISTDKAVNPTNIMGASKRICEMLIQSYNKHSKTEYVAVRFGNVLGSNGSVIPLFKEQISRGGPVTVTHPAIIRYFMTIPEAVSLVLQAGAYGKGGEIFILDMGEPVKIDELAKNLIRLSGFEPGKDIDIEYTGLRPGEKLYEELLMDEEVYEKTQNQHINIGKPIPMDDEEFYQSLERLDFAANEENEHIRQIVKGVVPTYMLGDLNGKDRCG